MCMHRRPRGYQAWCGGQCDWLHDHGRGQWCRVRCSSNVSRGTSGNLIPVRLFYRYRYLLSRHVAFISDTTGWTNAYPLGDQAPYAPCISYYSQTRTRSNLVDNVLCKLLARYVPVRCSKLCTHPADSAMEPQKESSLLTPSAALGLLEDVIIHRLGREVSGLDLYRQLQLVTRPARLMAA